MRNSRKIMVFFGLFLLINLFFIDFAFAVEYDNYSDTVVSCGEGMLTEIPHFIPTVTSVLYTVIQVVVPILLVVFGMIDLVKGVIGQKEEDIKKGQHVFIKRIIAAVLVFFVFALVKFFISLVADDNTKGLIGCADCFIDNECDIEDKFICKVNNYEITFHKDGYVQFSDSSHLHFDIVKEYVPKNVFDCENVEVLMKEDSNHSFYLVIKKK